jgi:hypothetical protein
VLEVAAHRERAHRVDHQLPVKLGAARDIDCDILAINRADLHIVLNWATSGSPDAAKLDVLRERVAAAAR